MKTITTFIIGMTVGLSFGYVLATQAWEDDVAAHWNREQHQRVETREAIQLFEYQKRPDTSIPFDAYTPYSSRQRPCY